jgi:hypothetical protein
MTCHDSRGLLVCVSVAFQKRKCELDVDCKCVYLCVYEHVKECVFAGVCACSCVCAYESFVNVSVCVFACA